MILCAFFDCIHSGSYIWCFKSSSVLARTLATDAGQIGWQRRATDRKNGRGEGTGPTIKRIKRKIPRCHTNNYTSTTPLHRQTRTHIHTKNLMHKVSLNSQQGLKKIDLRSVFKVRAKKQMRTIREQRGRGGLDETNVGIVMTITANTK